MYKIITFLVAALALTSCMSSYSIQGNINTREADGSLLYLKTYDAKTLGLANLDSCEIVHGQFHFNGAVDTVRIASVCTDNTELFPVMVESGDVKICSSNTDFTIGGTPLNEKLYGFYKAFTDILNEMQELQRVPAQAILNGEELDEVEFQHNADVLSARLDSLVTTCIKENIDNPLGPGVFFFVTKQAPPMLQPWIEELWMSASESFKNDSYVRDYYSMAKENQDLATGLKSSDSAPATQAPAPEAPAVDATPAPTPNELAGTATPADSTKAK